MNDDEDSYVSLALQNQGGRLIMTVEPVIWSRKTDKPVEGSSDRARQILCLTNVPARVMSAPIQTLTTIIAGSSSADDFRAKCEAALEAWKDGMPLLDESAQAVAQKWLDEGKITAEEVDQNAADGFYHYEKAIADEVIRQAAEAHRSVKKAEKAEMTDDTLSDKDVSLVTSTPRGGDYYSGILRGMVPVSEYLLLLPVSANGKSHEFAENFLLEYDVFQSAEENDQHYDEFLRSWGQSQEPSVVDC